MATSRYGAKLPGFLLSASLKRRRSSSVLSSPISPALSSGSSTLGAQRNALYSLWRAPAERPPAAPPPAPAPPPAVVGSRGAPAGLFPERPERRAGRPAGPSPVESPGKLGKPAGEGVALAAYAGNPPRDPPRVAR